MDTVYVETSIVSHATAWPSLDITAAALQHQARQWLLVFAGLPVLVLSSKVIQGTLDLSASVAL